MGSRSRKNRHYDSSEDIPLDLERVIDLESTMDSRASAGKDDGPRPTESISKKRPTKKKRDILLPGRIVASAKHKYKVSELLGSGGFGDVYRVQQDDGPNIYAMKTEQGGAGVNPRMLRLKMETRILTDCWNVKDENRKKHFVAMIDKGRTEQFKFLVMGLVGPSLDDIRKDIIQCNFSKTCALQICMQTCECVWDLHETGWLHRDIKPQNFCVGLDNNQSIIYMLDFGIARKFTEKDSRVMRLPREKVKFIGTIRFASRNCHLQKEQGRMDDLEVWMYMSVDIFDDAALPWRRVCDKNLVLKMKQQFFENPNPRVFKEMPGNFCRIMKYIDGLTYVEEPDYKYILDCMTKIGEDLRLNMKDNVDWHGKLKKKDAVDEEEEADLEKEDDEDDEEGDEDSGEEKKRKATKMEMKDKSIKRKAKNKDKTGDFTKEQGSVKRKRKPESASVLCPSSKMMQEKRVRTPKSEKVDNQSGK